MTDQESIRKGESLFAEWIAAIVNAADDALASEFGISVRRTESVTAVSSPKIPHPFINHIIGLGMNSPATEAQIDDLMARYPGGNFALSPAALPAHISEWLERRGFDHTATISVMRCNGEMPPEVRTSLRVEAIDPSQAATFAQILCAVGHPGGMARAAGVEPERFTPWFAAMVGQAGWRHYLAYDGDIPAATGAFYMKDRMAWLAFAATLPAYRRMGAQGALIARRVQDALALGCEDIFAGTIMSAAEEEAGQASPSRQNLIRSGFDLAYRDRLFVRRE